MAPRFAKGRVVLNTLRATAETRWPAAFASLCPLFDHLAARNPQHEVHLLPLFLAPGELACDIGANRGLFTYWLLRHQAQVAAFEPNPAMGEVLRHRFRRAVARDQLRIVEGALGDAEGRGTLHVPMGLSPLAALDESLGDRVGRPTRKIDVRLLRLDDCMDADVAFIKLDAEGHELKVLAGARRILERSRPTLLVEAEERHRAGAVRALRGFLEPLGLKGFFHDGQALVPINRFEPQRHQARSALNAAGTRALKGRAYVNNFIFAGRLDVIARLQAMGTPGS